jgi:hypothetical protein
MTIGQPEPRGITARKNLRPRTVEGHLDREADSAKASSSGLAFRHSSSVPRSAVYFRGLRVARSTISFSSRIAILRAAGSFSSVKVVMPGLNEEYSILHHETSETVQFMLSESFVLCASDTGLSKNFAFRVNWEACENGYERGLKPATTYLRQRYS